MPWQNTDFNKEEMVQVITRQSVFFNDLATSVLGEGLAGHLFFRSQIEFFFKLRKKIKSNQS